MSHDQHSVQVKEEPEEDDQSAEVAVMSQSETAQHEMTYSCVTSAAHLVSVKLEEFNHQLSVPNTTNYQVKSEDESEEPKIWVQSAVQSTSAVYLAPKGANLSLDDQIEGPQPETALNLPNASPKAPRPTRSCTISPQTTESPKRPKPKPTKPTSYRCTIPGCGRLYQSKGGLTDHLAVHSGTYTCSYCGLPCPNRKDLKRHNLTHSGTRPHQCTQCPAAFTERSHLIAHERTHSGDRPYRCTRCEKSFTVSSHLTRHLRAHSGLRPFSCTQCSAGFIQQSDLTVHSRLHSGQLRFRCEQCPKMFNQKHQLTRHERNKH